MAVFAVPVPKGIVEQDDNDDDDDVNTNDATATGLLETFVVFEERGGVILLVSYSEWCCKYLYATR